eukprot:1025818-Alexandrium_andersonii.AAC.1
MIGLGRIADYGLHLGHLALSRSQGEVFGSVGSVSVVFGFADCFGSIDIPLRRPSHRPPLLPQDVP